MTSRRPARPPFVLVALIVALILSTVTLPAAAQTPNFSGRWTLDAGASTGLPSGQPHVVLAIDQTPDRLVVRRTAGQTSKTTVYLLNGAEVVEQGNGIAVKRRSRWNAGSIVSEGTQTRSLLGIDVDVAFTETVRLEADGTLRVKTTMSGGGREQSRTSVYRRIK